MKDYVIDEKETKATWIYEYNMWKNPTIFLTVWKIFILCSLAPGIVVFASLVGDGFSEALFVFAKVYGLVAGIITVLFFLTYIIVCLINGGKYIVVFEMDKLGIKHIQMEKQFTKAQGVAYIGTIIGAIKKDLITMGSNMIACSKNSTYTEFKKVRKIENIKKRNTIKIRTSNDFNNQIYVDNEHYDIIFKMIMNKSPKKTIVKTHEENNI